MCVPYSAVWNKKAATTDLEKILSRQRDLALEKQHGGLITDRRADGNEFDVALDELRWLSPSKRQFGVFYFSPSWYYAFKNTFWEILLQSELIRPGLVRVRVVRSNFSTYLSKMAALDSKKIRFDRA